MNSNDENQSRTDVISGDAPVKLKNNKYGVIYTNGKRWWTSGTFIDLNGKRFGKLVVVGRLKNDKNGKTMWMCKCDCGELASVRGSELKRGHTASCGCYKSEVTTKRNIKQEYYWIYTMLIQHAKASRHSCELTYADILGFVKIERCHYCGERIKWEKHGIKGKLHGYRLDRVDNSLGYTKENCVVCCRTCNRIKGNQFKYEEMLKIGKFIKSVLDERR